MSDASTARRGIVDGQPVTFEDTLDRLSWQTLDAEDSKHGSVQGADVVAVVQNPSRSAYDVLCISPQAALEASRALPHLQTISVSNPPPSFVEAHLVRHLPPHLTLADVHVVISTLSGTAQASSFFTKVIQPVFSALAAAPLPYTVHRTTSAESIRDLTKNVFQPRALQGTAQTIVLLSGDGGVHDVINSLLYTLPSEHPTYTPPTLALLALGTGNALAHSLRLTQDDHSLGLRSLLHGSPRPLPFFSARFSAGARILTDEERSSAPVPHATIYGAVVLSYGLHASLVGDSDTAAYRKLGVDRFKQAAQDLLFPPDGSPPHAYGARVTLLTSLASTPHERVLQERTHSYILATLVSNLEQLFTISPRSQPARRTLHLLHIPPVSGAELAEITTLAYQGGKHVDRADVGYEEIDGLRIDVLPRGGGHDEGADHARQDEEEDRWRRVCVDGTIVRLEPSGWVELRLVGSEERAVDVIVP